MSALMREAGMSTRVPLAVTALRILVSMSAMGSVISLLLNPVIRGSGFGVRGSGFGVPGLVRRSGFGAERRTRNQTLNHELRTTNRLYQLLLVTPVMSPSSASLR